MAKIISADRFTALKASVKAECQRRAYTGSVSTYGGTSYDYTVTPGASKVILKEHRDKIATPLNAINSDTVAKASGVGVLSDDDMLTMEAMTTSLTSYTDITINASSGCKSSCTGLCYSACSGSCRGGCQGGCSGCGGACSSSCSGCTNCSGCGGACSSSCSGCTNCSGCSGCSGCGSCGGTCSGCSGCGSGCATSCGGCGGGCSGGCSGCGSGASWW